MGWRGSIATSHAAGGRLRVWPPGGGLPGDRADAGDDYHGARGTGRHERTRGGETGTRVRIVADMADGAGGIFFAMYLIEICRTFSAAHAIRLEDGILEPVHGHDWNVAITVAATDVDGMEVVMDFHALESMLDALLATVHNRHLNEVPPFVDEDGDLAVNPTAERVAWWLAGEVAPTLPPHVHLDAVRVGEAPGCSAIYRPPPLS